MQDIHQVNLASPEVLPNPYEVYAQLRRDGGITWNEHYKAWLISTHEYVRSLLSHPSVSAQKLGPFAAKAAPELRPKIEAMEAVMKDWVVFNDPPRHTRLRKVIQRGFMPRNVAALEPKIREATRALLDGLQGRETIDFLEDFAYRLPAMMICDLFGIPAEDSEKVAEWATEMTTFVLGSPKKGKYDTTLTSLMNMRDYFAAKVAARKQEPSQHRDLVDLLIDSQEEADGLTDDEIVASLVLIVFGGHETTANMIGNAMKSLIEHKDALRALRADPSRIPAALEELMRFDGPAPVVTRVAKEDFEFAGKNIVAGTRLFLILHSANHDEAVFDRPEQLDIARARCPHIQFSGGMHACAGAPLARLEGRIVFEELFARYEDFELAEPTMEWRDELMSRGPRTLRVRLTPVAVHA